MITRLSGGLSPASGTDPRTFPDIWNATADDIEAIESDVTTLQSDVTTIESDITTIESDLNTAESNITTLQSELNTAESNITTLQSELNTAESNITTLQSDLNTVEANYVSRLSVSGTTAMFVGERNAAMAVGNNLSLGNNSTGKSIGMPFAGVVLGVMIAPGTAHTGSTTLQLVKNNTLQGTNYQIVASGVTNVSIIFTTPLAFAALDDINLQATAITTPADGLVGTIIVRFD
jgi:uncharacterized phage infection (PIP) family protein YhgE